MMARSHVVRRAFYSFLLLAGVAGCKASMNAEAKAGSSGASASADADAEANASMTSERTEPAPGETDLDKPVEVQSPVVPSSPVSRGPALLGARRDLSYQGPKQANCSCLAVHLGEPDDAAFKWEKAPPQVDTTRQLVVGLSSDGVACDTDPGLGASYKGYVVSGDDVVVMVERAHEGIPVQQGAVIPRPVGMGQVYVVAAEKGSPFGGAVGHPKERCAIELPAAGTLTAEENSFVNDDAAPEPPETAGGGQEPSEFVDVVDEDGLGDEKPLERPETRDGFFLGLHPTLGYLMLRERGGNGASSGLGFGFDALLGGSPTEGLAVGAILGGMGFPKPSREGAVADLGSDIVFSWFHIGGFADYYPDPGSGLHLLAELAYAQLSSSGDRAQSQDYHGFALAGGLGYDWWVSANWSLGFTGRFTFASLRHQELGSDFWVLLPGFNFTATYH